ncbi:hypothetical protein NDU88_000676, partial [Pleurodeles waltl]
SFFLSRPTALMVSTSVFMRAISSSAWVPNSEFPLNGRFRMRCCASCFKPVSLSQEDLLAQIP